MKLLPLLENIEPTDPKVISYLKRHYEGKTFTTEKHGIRFRVEKIIHDWVDVRPKPYNAITFRINYVTDEGKVMTFREVMKTYKPLTQKYAVAHATKGAVCTFLQISVKWDIAGFIRSYLDESKDIYVYVDPLNFNY